jgi:hypothetical protein
MFLGEVTRYQFTQSSLEDGMLFFEIALYVRMNSYQDVLSLIRGYFSTYSLTSVCRADHNRCKPELR